MRKIEFVLSGPCRRYDFDGNKISVGRTEYEANVKAQKETTATVPDTGFWRNQANSCKALKIKRYIEPQPPKPPKPQAGNGGK